LFSWYWGPLLEDIKENRRNSYAVSMSTKRNTKSPQCVAKSTSFSHCSSSVVSKANAFVVRCNCIHDDCLFKQARNIRGLCMGGWIVWFGHWRVLGCSMLVLLEEVENIVAIL
jgi:hypothetical protein